MATRRLVSVAAPLGAGLAVVLAATVSAVPAEAATSLTIPLKSAHTNQLATSTAFGKSCDQIPGGVSIPGRDGWVFVLPGDVGGSFTQLLITFRDPQGQEVAIGIQDPTSQYQNGIVQGQGDNKAFVVTPAGWTLVRGEAQVTGAKDGKAKTADFNVTHTCVGGTGAQGGGSPSPSSGGGVPGTTPETPTATPGSPTTTPGTQTTPSTPSGSLPVTGVDLVGMIAGAVTMVGAGIALLVLRRRRARVSFTA